MITLLVDEDVIVADLLKAFAQNRMTLTNIEGWAFRLSRVESIAKDVSKVVDLSPRRAGTGAG